MLLCVWLWSGIKKKLSKLLPKTYLMGFISGLLGFATAFTNFSAIWILHTNEIIQKMISISWGVSKPDGAVLPLVEVFISHISAVQHQCVHDVNCIDPTLRLALRNGCIHTTMRSKTKPKCSSLGFRMEPCFLHLTSPFSSWTISTLKSVSLGSSSLKFSSFLQRRGIFPSHVYIWDFCTGTESSLV